MHIPLLAHSINADVAPNYALAIKRSRNPIPLAKVWRLRPIVDRPPFLVTLHGLYLSPMLMLITRTVSDVHFIQTSAQLNSSPRILHMDLGRITQHSGI